jgi:hypothetical protein
MKHYWNSSGTCIVLTLLLLIFISRVSAQNSAHITDGVCDARKIDLTERRIQLNGYWRIVKDRLITPEQLKQSSSEPIYVPSLWNDADTRRAGVGYGTYVLRIILPPHLKGKKLGLEIPQLYNSYHLFINDSLLASNGTPGSSADSSLPQWRPQSIQFSSHLDTTTILLQLSNFHHFKGGIREPIYLGLSENIDSHFSSSYVSTFAEVVLLFLLSVFFLVLFRLRGNKRIILYFSLLCLSWGVREMFSDIYLISQLCPDINWFFLVRIEYISLFVTMVYAILFLSRLFPDVSNKLLKYLLVAINIIFIGFTLLAPVIMFTRWLPLYLGTCAVVLVYAGILILRAMSQEKRGAWYLMGGLLLTLMTMGYDLVAYKGIVVNNILVGSIGYCLIFTCSAIGLLQSLQIIKTGDNTLRYEDLYK